MPKQFKTYTRFEGGLNTKTNSRSIQDNELAQANNVIVDEFGAIKSCGKAVDNTSDYTAPALTASQPGYGLFQATFDYASGGGNTSTVRTFLANADDTTNAVIHVLDATTWDTNDISLGAVTGSEQAKVIYHIADGTVKSCDTNIANTATVIKNYKYYKSQTRWRSSFAGSAVLTSDEDGWKSFGSTLPAPTVGGCGLHLVGVTASSGNSTTAFVTSGSFGTFTTAAGHYAVDRESGTHATEAVTYHTNSTTFVMPSGGVTWGDDAAYAIYPPTASASGGTGGFNLDFTVGSGASTWTSGTYKFATTFVYENGEESLPFELSGTVAVGTNNYVTCEVLASEDPATGTAGYPVNAVGARIYHKLSTSDDEWVLFGDVSFTYGGRPTLDGTYKGWSLDVASTGLVFCTFTSLKENLDTYETINGYSSQTSILTIGAAGEKYQTSVVTNRRVFVANIKYTDGSGNLVNRGDQIRYSLINKFNSFPEFNFIDIGVNDGEDFVKLEAFADRLFAYKEKTLYIINIGGGSDTQWFLESENKNMGVEFHAATVKTDFGIAWVNKNGLFFYDGSQIRNLQTKIKEDDWNSFFTPSFTDATCDYNNDPTIAMDSTTKLIVGMGVSGTGIPVGAYVGSITDSTSFELSIATTGGSVTNGTLTFTSNNSSNGSILGYEPTHKHLVSIRDAGASGGNSGDAYIYSFITNSFTFVEDLVADSVKTNVITDSYNNLTFGKDLAEIVSYDGESDNHTTFDIILKDDDFDLPNVVKKIYGVTIEYASGAANSDGLKYYYTNDSGTKQVVSDGTASQDLASTSNDLDVNKITFSTPLLASSFQVRLDMDGDSIQKVNNVGVEYRPIHKRVT